MYFLGYRQISRAEYVDAVGAADCDPHVLVARKKQASRKTTKTIAKKAAGERGGRRR